MVAISFSKKLEFPEMIRKGTKDQTIRPFNAKRFEQMQRIGKLQLYWKQRTKECYKIADAELTEIFRIMIVPTPHKNHTHCVILKCTSSFNPISSSCPVSEKEYNEILTRDGLTVKEFYTLFRETYGDTSHMKFMVIRFKVIK